MSAVQQSRLGLAGLGSKSWVGSGLLRVSPIVLSDLGCVFLAAVAEALEHKPNCKSTLKSIFSVGPNMSHNQAQRQSLPLSRGTASSCGKSEGRLGVKNWRWVT